jgi:hypothetical protein
MRAILLASVMALGLVQTGMAAGRKPAYDPITDPNLTQQEMDVRAGVIAMASTLLYQCSNVPWQLSTNFGRNLVAWSRQQGISPERSQFIIEMARQQNQYMPCDDVPSVMASISRNWMGR